MNRFLPITLLLLSLLSACAVRTEPAHPTNAAPTARALPPTWTLSPIPVPSETHAAPSTSPTPFQVPPVVPGLNCESIGTFVVMGENRSAKGAVDLAVSTNYAYLTGPEGLWIIDVSNPSSPFNTWSADHPPSTQIIYQEGYLYGIDPKGFWIMDTPQVPMPDFMTYNEIAAGPVDFKVNRGHAYVRDNFGVVHIFDVNNPYQVNEIGLHDPPGQILGGEIYGNTIATIRALTRDNALDSLLISDDYLYIADMDAGMHVVDISDPSNPQSVTTHELSSSVSDVEMTENHMFIFGLPDETDGLRWDVWAQEISEASTGIEPSNFGTIAMRAETNLTSLCPFLTAMSEIISESEPGSGVDEILATEILDVLLGVEVSGEYIFVADQDRGLVILQLELDELVLQQNRRSLEQLACASDPSEHFQSFTGIIEKYW